LAMSSRVAGAPFRQATAVAGISFCAAALLPGPDGPQLKNKKRGIVGPKAFPPMRASTPLALGPLEPRASVGPLAPLRRHRQALLAEVARRCQRAAFLRGRQSWKLLGPDSFESAGVAPPGRRGSRAPTGPRQAICFYIPAACWRGPFRGIFPGGPHGPFRPPDPCYLQPPLLWQLCRAGRATMEFHNALLSGPLFGSKRARAGLFLGA